jgi:hypothetical protein
MILLEKEAEIGVKWTQIPGRFFPAQNLNPHAFQ